MRTVQYNVRTFDIQLNHDEDYHEMCLPQTALCPLINQLTLSRGILITDELFKSRVLEPLEF